MSKEDLLFRLETFKGQLETFETSLRRSLAADKADKEGLQKELMRLNKNYAPLKDFVSYFGGGHHFSTALRGVPLSQAGLSLIGSCVTDVSITSAQIARMDDTQFSDFMKRIEYTRRRRQDEAEAAARRVESEKRVEEGATSDQSPIQSQMVQGMSQQVVSDKRPRTLLLSLAVGLAILAVVFSIYVAIRQPDSLQGVREDIAEIGEQNSRFVSDMRESIKTQTELVNSMTMAIEQTTRQNNEKLGDLLTSLAGLNEDLGEIVGAPETGGGIFVPLKLGTVSVVVEIDPVAKKGLIRGRNTRTGDELIKRLDPATINLLIWEFSELEYRRD
jgi:hypothetical protein